MREHASNKARNHLAASMQTAMEPPGTAKQEVVFFSSGPVTVGRQKY